MTAVIFSASSGSHNKTVQTSLYLSSLFVVQPSLRTSSMNALPRFVPEQVPGCPPSPESFPPPRCGSTQIQFIDCCHAFISSTHHGSGACQVEGAVGPVTVLGAQGVEEGTQQVEDLNLEGVRGLVACVEGAEEDSCYSPVADTLVASWVAGRKKEEAEGLEVVLQTDRRGGDMAALGVRSWAA